MVIFKQSTHFKRDFTDHTGGFMNSRNNISLYMFNYKIVVLEYRLLYLRYHMHCCKKYGALLLPWQFECKSTDKSKDYCLQLATFGGNCVKQTNLDL